MDRDRVPHQSRRRRPTPWSAAPGSSQVYRHEHIFIAVLIVGLVWVGTYVQTKRSQLRSLPG